MLPPLFDIGVNLLDRSFDSDRLQVLDRARSAGVTGFLLTGTKREESIRAAEFAAGQATGDVWSTAGVHPHYASTCDDQVIETLRSLGNEDRVVAIGECGLDYCRDLSPRPAQRSALTAQLRVAIELNLPVFLHDREAHADFASILREHRQDLRRGGVVHCFTGTSEELDAYLEMDFHIGITGWICDERRGQHLLDLVGRIPSNRLMLETDAPYLLPRSIRPKPRSRRNEPAHLIHVLEAVARARGEEAETVARATTETARTLFAL